MSNRSYNLLWDKAQRELKSTILNETQLFLGKVEKDRDIAYKSVSRIYVQYVRIYRKIEECYDQILHPQKRILLRKLLESVIGRILELKHDLVNLDYLEYSYHDETLSEKGIPPGELELNVPHFVLSERVDEFDYWNGLISGMKAKMVDSDGEVEEEEGMSPKEAVLLIQRHERARQGRLRAQLMKEIRRQEHSERNRSKIKSTMDAYVAAIRIQSAWKGIVARKKVRELRNKELAFIGMTPPANMQNKYNNEIEGFKERRRVLQSEFAGKYEKALVEVKEDLKGKEGSDIAERMKEDIRSWFQTERDEQGKFPDYPSDEEGGSAAIFHPEYFNEDAPTGAVPEEGSKKGKPNKEGGDKKTTSGSGSGDKELEDEESGYRPKHSEFLKTLKSAEDIYIEYWVKKKELLSEGKPSKSFQSVEELIKESFNTFDVWKNKDESHNKIQSFDLEMIKEEKRAEVEEEIRRKVDDLMREELELLKIAVERDKGKKGKISKKRKKAKKKANKKGKKKKDKDLTPDRTTESLVEELVQNGIIRTYPKVRLSDLAGDISYTAMEMKKRGNDPAPGAGDIRRTIAEYCILPMASQHLRENTPHIKSVLLVGPEGVGKTMILNAICNELGAVLFDLTATNIVGKYPGKSGLNMLLHLVFKVSKLSQPSIIFIDAADKTFLKKVSKTDKSDPKRLKKDLPRLVRSLSSEDRVLLIGASRQPWECEQKGLMQTYQKLLVLPKPDYSYRSTVWKSLITAGGGLISARGRSDDFDLSSLSKISDGYTSGHIKFAVSQVLSERRLIQQNQGGQTLKASEFIIPLSKCEPVYREEEEALWAWYAKTPMGKKRHKLLEGDDEEGGAGTGNASGGKKEKKKKKGKKKT